MKIVYKTNIEVYNTLIGVENKSKSEADTLSYVEKFLKYDKNINIKELASNINKVHKIPEEAIIKIIDIKPNSREELIAILNSYNINLDDSSLDGILDLMQVI
jgi:DNA-directed RNA polymerase subunit F